jgi:hypothetical protein
MGQLIGKVLSSTGRLIWLLPTSTMVQVSAFGGLLVWLNTLHGVVVTPRASDLHSNLNDSLIDQ